VRKDVQVTVVGKVIKPNKNKVLALNRCLEDYFELVKLYLSFNSALKTFLHKNCYEEAKRRFSLHTALIQTARDKAVEILRGFNERTKEGKTKAERPELKRISIRFDVRCFSFAKTTNKLTPYWLELEPKREGGATHQVR